MPYYLQFIFPGMDLRVLRVLRMLRILKLTHYNSALQDLFMAIIAEKRAFGSAVFLVTIATIVSASLMYFAEGSLQPEHLHQFLKVFIGLLSPLAQVTVTLSLLQTLVGLSLH